MVLIFHIFAANIMMQSISPLLYKYMNILIWVFAAFLLVGLKGYEEIDGVIVLTGDDLPKLGEISTQLFVLYYVPWYTCDHVGASIVLNSSLSLMK